MTTAKKRGPTPPKHLSAAAKKWWKQVDREFELEDHHRHLLTLAAQSWDRATQAREVIAEEGITVLDRYGCPKAHPAVAIERDSQLRFARLLREMQLDDEPEPPRIPRKRGQY